VCAPLVVPFVAEANLRMIDPIEPPSATRIWSLHVAKVTRGIR